MVTAAQQPQNSPPPSTSGTASTRVLSIDALRGFDMFWLMQDGTGFVMALAVALHLPYRDVIAHQLEHTPWVGFTCWDFIAPLFLFVVGLSLPFAISSRLARGEPKNKTFLHITKRTITLILLGLVYNGIFQLNFADFRYTGVLQRIGLSYFFAAWIALRCRFRTQVLWTAILLLGYWAMMALIPVPGFGHGVYTQAGNLEGYIDRLFLPGKFCCYVFGDNEGYLSTIPSVATVMLGVLCGHLIRSPWTHARKLQVLIGGGIVSLAGGLLWGMTFPIITRLWTSSYVLYTNGWAMLLFALFYWIIDVRGYRKWAFPLVVIGMNAITIYLLQNLFDFSQVSSIVVGGLANHAGSYRILVTSSGIILAEWLLLYFLYRHKIFLKA